MANLVFGMHEESRHVKAHGVVALTWGGKHRLLARCALAKGILKAFLGPNKQVCALQVKVGGGAVCREDPTTSAVAKGGTKVGQHGAERWEAAGSGSDERSPRRFGTKRVCGGVGGELSGGQPFWVRGPAPGAEWEAWSATEHKTQDSGCRGIQTTTLQHDGLHPLRTVLVWVPVSLHHRQRIRAVATGDVCGHVRR